MTRRNSFLNEIKEDHSAEFNDDLAQEFQDSDDEDGSLSLGAVVNDDELLNMLATRDPEASRASLLEDETAHDEEEGDNSSSKTDKSITDKIRKRTRLARQVTLVFFLSLGLGALLGSFFITRHEDCKDKREEYTLLSETLKQATQSGISDRIHSLQVLAKLVASDPWPYYLSKDFYRVSEEVRNTGGFSTLYLAPWVEDESEWDRYVNDQVTAGNVAESLLVSKDENHVTTTPVLPIWQVAPDMYTSVLNYNLLELDVVNEAVKAHSTKDGSFHIGSLAMGAEGNKHTGIEAFTIQPFGKQDGSDGKPGGYLLAVSPWEDLFGGILPPGSEPLTASIYRLNNPSNMLANVYVDGPEATLYTEPVEETKGGCHEVVCFPINNVYGTCLSPAAEDTYSEPSWPYMCIALVGFILMCCVFCLYDRVLFIAQRELAQAADQSLAVVSSLFPKDFKDRLFHRENSATFAPAEEAPKDRSEHNGASTTNSLFNKSGIKRGLARTKSSLTNFLHDSSEGSEQGGVDYFLKTKPIADLFPETTIMFADLVGFTAWSSAREPTSVFRLLETIYYHFDEIAKQRRVFKVETVGDCYVAVAGLPQPRKDHAMVMCRFARDCLLSFQILVKQLEVELGPDTGDLNLRVGIHSGQTTAGILRGDRQRFQLFGDTVNVTSRMESTGLPGRVQLSQQTADILIASGKEHWIVPREEEVMAKGKGALATYWLEIYSAGSQGSGGMYSETEYTEAMEGSSSPAQEVGGELQRTFSQQILQPTETHLSEAERHSRLVEWNAELLGRLLKSIIARRRAGRKKPDKWEDIQKLEDSYKEREALVMDEVVEVIEMPSYSDVGESPENIELPSVVVQQLKAFVETISYMYRDNPFHNFEHASHVCMSVNKLLGRIVAPDLQLNGSTDIEHKLHDHTYGITSDPLTQFSCVLCALIHDVDHTGLPNSVLVAEKTPLATTYNNRSVAEQNSIDLAWDALMGPQYVELRRTIYQTKEEFERFRKLLVNAVLATDIMDKDLKALRNKRWEKTFADKSQGGDYEDDDVNRKATIVIEHIIQASDVAHTMQHWQIYRKWNERLYEELYNAYTEGRMETDPTENWYKGEIGFLDFYVIPLAKKLKECGVFGVSSDEYLSYALQNKEEWIAKGQSVIAEMRQKMDRARGRKGKSLKTMSLLHGPTDFSARGNSSFSSFSSYVEPGLSSPIRSNSRRHLLSATGSRRNLLKSTGSNRSLRGAKQFRRASAGVYESTSSGSVVSLGNRRNSTGSSRHDEFLGPRQQSRRSLLKQGSGHGGMPAQNALKYSNHSMTSEGDQRNPKEGSLREMLKANVSESGRSLVQSKRGSFSQQHGAVESTKSFDSFAQED